MHCCEDMLKANQVISIERAAGKHQDRRNSEIVPLHIQAKPILNGNFKIVFTGSKQLAMFTNDYKK